MKHLCNRMSNGTNWMHCCVCDGRVHEQGCTSRKNEHTDCCEARHKMLFDKGIRVGVCERSLPMWDPSAPTWWD